MSTRKAIPYVAAFLVAIFCTTAMAQEKSTSRGSRAAAKAAVKDAESKSSGPALKFPNHGVRFVICSPTGERVPSPLYTKVKKDYLPLYISSRMPSPRVAPIRDVVNMYEEEPENDKATPYLSVEVPKEYQRKGICVMMPDKGGRGGQRFFLNEKDFAIGGTYIVNLSKSPLEMLTSRTGDFQGEEIRSILKPFDGERKLTDKGANVWCFDPDAARKAKARQAKEEAEEEAAEIASGSDKREESKATTEPDKTKPAKEKKDKKKRRDNRKDNRVFFVLSARLNDGTKVRIKAGVFMPDSKFTQMNFVVDHPEKASVFRLLSLQYADLKEESTGTSDGAEVGM